MRPILLWPDPRLKTAAAPVDAVTDATRAIWDEMIAVMEAMPGVGLAAPQIGEMQRLAVVDASDERGYPVRLADPTLLDASDEMSTHLEGSPCLPGVSAKIKRPARVVVGFLNERGEAEERAFTGLWATSVQHQIDHLDGKLYIAHLSPTKRQMVLKKAAKARG